MSWLARPRPLLRRAGLQCLLALALSACASAPVVTPAAGPIPAAFHEAAADGAADHLAAPRDEAWWQVFGDPGLDALMQQALQRNPGLQQARARVAQAAALVGLRAAAAQPQLGLGLAASRQRGTLVNEAGQQGDLFRADARLRLDLDLLGTLSRGEQAARHDLQAQQALQRQAELLLQAQLAQTHLARQALARERAAHDQVLLADRALLAIAERQQRAGLAAEPQRQAALAELRDDEIESQELARRQALLGHALAALSDQPLDAGPLAQTEPPALPALPQIPAGLPSRMLLRRADVAAAEQSLQAARLRLGLARDAWFPQLTLTASAGLASGELSQWLRAAARNAGLGLLLSLPGLDGGRADAERDAAAASLQAATAAHREQVLLALREVEDELATRRSLLEQAEARRQGAALAEAEAARLEARWQRGFAGEAQVWQARRQAQRQHRLWLQLQARQLESTISLVRALGGGWGEPAQRTVAQRSPA